MLGADEAGIADFFEVGIETCEAWRRRYPDFAAGIAASSTSKARVAKPSMLAKSSDDMISFSVLPFIARMD